MSDIGTLNGCTIDVSRRMNVMRWELSFRGLQLPVYEETNWQRKGVSPTALHRIAVVLMTRCANCSSTPASCASVLCAHGLCGNVVLLVLQCRASTDISHLVVVNCACCKISDYVLWDEDHHMLIPVRSREQVPRVLADALSNRIAEIKPAAGPTLCLGKKKAWKENGPLDRLRPAIEMG
jgi:hypothetical protein